MFDVLPKGENALRSGRPARWRRCAGSR